jgi:hypothetical protein
MSSRKLEDMNFEELVEWQTQKIHSGLLEGGGHGLKNAVFTALDTAIAWNKHIEQDAGAKEFAQKRIMHVGKAV